MKNFKQYLQKMDKGFDLPIEPITPLIMDECRKASSRQELKLIVINLMADLVSCYSRHENFSGRYIANEIVQCQEDRLKEIYKLRIVRN